MKSLFTIKTQKEEKKETVLESYVSTTEDYY